MNNNIIQRPNYVTYHQTTSILLLKKDLQIIFINAPALNGIFSTHQVKNVNGHTKMRPYSKALCAINPLSNTETENVEIENLVSISFAEKVTVGSFVIVPYLFSSSSSAHNVVTRKIVVVVTNVKENDIEIECGRAVSKKRIKFIGNDKGFISKDSTLAVLPQPSYKRSVYEFLDEFEIDVTQ